MSGDGLIVIGTFCIIACMLLVCLLATSYTKPKIAIPTTITAIGTLWAAIWCLIKGVNLE